jgi:hypothetical protein
MSIPPLDTPSDEDLYRRIWLELQRAAQDRHHDWRTPVLTSVDAQGVPQARTVVLREVNTVTRALTFYTDSRSPKVAELQAAPQSALVFWSKRLSWQLRVSARVRVDTTGPLLDAAWSRVSQSAAAGDYLSATAPGSPLHLQGTAPDRQHNMAILIAQVDVMDWLELARSGHRRALLTPDRAEWRVP